jgi:hypothetical protein
VNSGFGADGLMVLMLMLAFGPVRRRWRNDK